MVSRTTLKIPDYSLAEVQSSPLSFLTKLAEGNSRIIPYKVDGRLIILVNHPDIVKYVLSSKNKYFVKNDTPEMYMLKPVLGNGMLTSDGHLWKAQRNTSQVAFTKEYTQRYISLMVSETSKMIDSWKHNSKIDLEVQLSKLTLQIVASSLFGFTIEKDAEKFGQAVKVINQYMGHYNPFDLAAKEVFRQALEFVRSLVSDFVNTKKVSGQQTDNLLNILLGAPNNESEENSDHDFLVDQIFTFLMAGHETTAKALTWTLYELMQNSKELLKLEQEIDVILRNEEPNLINIHNLEYCWMALREGMRLHPPVWILSRTAATEDVIEGFNIPKGATILISPFLLHQNSKFWTNPEKFIPARFLFEEENKRDPNVYIPFSAGPRRCIGMNFANIEMVVVLAMITKRFRFQIEEGFKVEPEALVTLRPKNGMKVITVKK